MISYRIGFLECEHRRASNGQHARKGLFNDSFPPCQVLIRANSTDRYFRQIWPEIADSAALDLIRQRFSGKKRLEIGDHAILHRDVRLKGMTADMRRQHDVRKCGQCVRGMGLLLVDVDAKILRKLGKDGYVVNISRGSVIDQAALVAALAEESIAGAGLDVYQ
jgi:hypothetical protein